MMKEYTLKNKTRDYEISGIRYRVTKVKHNWFTLYVLISDNWFPFVSSRERTYLDLMHRYRVDKFVPKKLLYKVNYHTVFPKENIFKNRFQI